MQEEQQFQDKSYGMFTVRTDATEPIMLDVCINGIPIKMEFDTGASLSIPSSTTYYAIAEKSEISALKESKIHLKIYTGEEIPVLGTTTFSVRYAEVL